MVLLLPLLLPQPASRADVGRAIDIAAETVHKAGVIFVASAGNAGEQGLSMQQARCYAVPVTAVAARPASFLWPAQAAQVKQVWVHSTQQFWCIRRSAT